MELNQLRYFYFVAKEGSFTRAAKALRVQQPAVSRKIRQLEESSGHELFAKNGRGVRLTKVGSDLYRLSQSIFEQVERVDELLSKSRDEAKGPLTIAASDLVASHWLARLLPPFLGRHRLVLPSLYTTMAAEGCNYVAEGRVDFGLFFHVPDLRPELEIKRRWPLLFKLVVATSRAKDPAVLKSFIGSREIDDTETKTFPTLKRLRHDYPDVTIKLSTNSLSTHRELAIAGFGVAILPESLVAVDIATGKLKSLYDDERFVFDLKLLTRRGAQLSLTAATFLEDSTF